MLYSVKALREKLRQAEIAEDDAQSNMQRRREEISKSSAYGASKNTGPCQECSDDEPEIEEEEAEEERRRAPRVSDEDRRRRLLQPRELMRGIQPKHFCKCPFDDSLNFSRECSWSLYGDGMFRDQVERFSAARNGFLTRSSAGRREAGYDNMRIHAEAGGNGNDRKIEYTVNGRLVCRAVFLECFPMSKSTLRRLERRLLAGIGPHGIGAAAQRTTSEKRLQVIAWWLAYAAATAERLPDVPHLYTPCRLKTEIFDEYRADLRAANRASLIVHPATFASIYRNASELDHITISRGKRNFTRCSLCVTLEARLQKALKAHDSAQVKAIKAERQAHHATMRADRLAYYSRREEARKTNTVLTLIIDKMDQAKNLVPCFTRRWPKDAEKYAVRCLTLHVAGVLIHGEPDKRYLFPASQQLSGDANLNLECLRRALLRHIQTTFREELHLQFDNAKDNKCKYVFGLLGWLVLNSKVKRITVAMLPTGHTHEDIDAMFRQIADELRRLQFIGTMLVPSASLRP